MTNANSISDAVVTLQALPQLDYAELIGEMKCLEALISSVASSAANMKVLRKMDSDIADAVQLKMDAALKAVKSIAKP